MKKAALLFISFFALTAWTNVFSYETELNLEQLKQQYNRKQDECNAKAMQVAYAAAQQVASSENFTSHYRKAWSMAFSQCMGWED